MSPPPVFCDFEGFCSSPLNSRSFLCYRFCPESFQSCIHLTPPFCVFSSCFLFRVPGSSPCQPQHTHRYRFPVSRLLVLFMTLKLPHFGQQLMGRSGLMPLILLKGHCILFFSCKDFYQNACNSKSH